MPGGASSIRWLMVAALAPATIWWAGRAVDRMWFGHPSVTSDAQALATVQQKLEHRYGALFQELSTATEAAG